MDEQSPLGKRQERRLRRELGRDTATRVELRRDIRCTSCGTLLGSWLYQPGNGPAGPLRPRLSLHLRGALLPPGNGAVDDDIPTYGLDQRPGRWISYGAEDSLPVGGTVGRYQIAPALRRRIQDDPRDDGFVPEVEICRPPLWTSGLTLRSLGSNDGDERAAARSSLTEASAAAGMSPIVIRVICPRCAVPNILDSNQLRGVGAG